MTLLQFQDLRVIPVRRDPLDQKVLEARRDFRVQPEFRASRVFRDLREILVLPVLLGLLVQLANVVPLVLMEKMRLVRSFPTTSPR